MTTTPTSTRGRTARRAPGPGRARGSGRHASAGRRVTGRRAASGATRPPIDPRIRQRRVAIARREGRRRLFVLLGALAVVGLAIGAWFVLHSSLLSARVISVSGSAHTPTAVIVDTGGLATHPPLVSLDPGAVAARIEQLPWVAQASVTREWPDGVHVQVVERTPVAVMKGARGNVLVDVQGRVLATAPAPVPGLPTLVAPVVAPAPGGTVPGAALPGLDVAASLPAAFRAQVRQVVLDTTGLHLDLTYPVTVTLGSTSQLHQKYEDVAALLAGAGLHPGDDIDVTAPGSPTVTP